MTDIQVLPPDVVNQIAAGEVVTRPASAVRELLDNAVDAAATDIEIEIEKGGKKKIRVRDNGAGMDDESLQLAVAPHATSKIRNSDDLQNVRTLGFRGEALASIFSVSRMDLLSRPASSASGFRLIGSAGRVASTAPAASSPGTTVTLRDLFWNVPARRKFLRSDASETRAVTEAVIEKALAYPAFAFRYIRDGQEAMNLTGKATLKERIEALFGRDISGACIPFERESPSIRVRGLASDPSVVKSTRGSIYLFVNGRRIQDPRLGHAILTVYREILSQGFPAIFLFIEIDPHLVDVNVHPAKAEVRFSDASWVYRFTAETLAQAIHGPAPVPVSSSAVALPRVTPGPSIDEDRSADQPSWEPAAAPQSPVAVPVMPMIAPTAVSSRFRLFGQIYKTFLLAEDTSTGEFHLIDQHVASERILLSRMTARIESHAALSQGLLVPLVLELGLKDAILFERVAGALRKMGFETEPFGPRGVWVVRAVPTILGRRVADRKMFLKFVEELSSFDTTRRAEEELFHDVLAHFACRSAIKAGDALLPEEQAQLVSDLLAVEHFRICPHGRPSMIKITREELERRFQRT